MTQQTEALVRACEVMWVPARAALAVEIMRDLNGGVTPCERGLACPVFNRSGDVREEDKAP